MPDDSNVPHITMASNKQEMLDAYSAMKQLLFYPLIWVL